MAQAEYSEGEGRAAIILQSRGSWDYQGRESRENDLASKHESDPKQKLFLFHLPLAGHLHLIIYHGNNERFRERISNRKTDTILTYCIKYPISDSPFGRDSSVSGVSEI